jgi:nitrogen fixation NifU-like protein
LISLDSKSIEIYRNQSKSIAINRNLSQSIDINRTMDLYAQNILDRYKTPFHKDKSARGDIMGGEVNHSCGDNITVKIELRPSTSSGSKIEVQNYSFSGEGCAISQAAADILGDLIIGKTLDDVLKMTKDELFEALGIEISLRRTKCALLSLSAVKNAILKYKGEEPSVSPTNL